jgi:hypothetical protein
MNSEAANRKSDLIKLLSQKLDKSTIKDPSPKTQVPRLRKKQKIIVLKARIITDLEFGIWSRSCGMRLGSLS